MNTKLGKQILLRSLRLVPFAMLLLALSAQSAHAAAVRYVKPNGAISGACDSWTNACGLQYALSIAVSGDDIWVMAGTYTPGTLRTDTFRLKNGVGLYGGFAGTEAARDQRNWTTNVTTLSGEIGVAGISDNTHHIVRSISANSTAILDGFTVSGGNANGDPNPPGNYDIGGGMFNGTINDSESGSPTVRNVIFSGNSAYYEGGGMFNYHASSPTLINVTFIGNTATRPDSYGGAMDNYINSNPTLTNVTFTGNSAAFGGALDNFNNSSPTLINVTFSGNFAAYGGAMHNERFSNPTLTNVTISGNTASGKSDSSGGGIVNDDNSKTTIRNSIVWGNTAVFDSQIHDGSTSMSTIIFSDIQGGCPARSACSNIINADPRLGALGNYGGTMQTIPLLPGSAAIDAANDSVCPATDQRGVARPQGAHCDMGAFEFASSSAPTNTPIATATSTATSTPTNTPTNPPLPPSATPTNTPTNSPTATATSTATNSPLPPTATPTRTVVQLTATPTKTTVSVGSICVLVWNDLNGNGLRDGTPIEPLMSGATVSLYTISGIFVDSQKMNSGKSRCFTGLAPGQYWVVEENESGYTSTTPDTVNATVFANVTTNVEFGDLRVTKK